MRSISLHSLVSIVVASFSAVSAFAIEVKEGPTVSATESSATIRWTTDNVCGTRLNYGLSPTTMSQRVEGALGVAHEVTIGDLRPGTTYHYAVGTKRVELKTGSFTTTGAPVAQPMPKEKPAEVAKPKGGLLNLKIPSLFKPKPAALPAAPPTRQTWGWMDSLQDHWERHGADFKSKSPDEYAAQAWQFLERAKRDGLPMKFDTTDGSVRVWDPKTRDFASYDRRGKTRTYFRPSNPSYWERQPGKPVSASQLPF
jgi:hypothetical protein